MAEMIICPACGEATSKEFEFCQYCQSRLQPLTGNLKSENAPIKPGDLPTKKSTADLEPVLPQWLRDARQSARDATAENAQPAQPNPSSPRSPAPGDFLAGLQSQAGDDDDEEVPDWLSNLTGAAPAPKKPKQDDNMRWVDLSAPKSEPEMESDLPAWMQGTAETSSPQPAADSQDWLNHIADDRNAMFTPAEESPASAESSDTPDWMRQMQAADSDNTAFDSAPAGDTPDWLRSLDTARAGYQNDEPLFETPKTNTASSESDTPDWLSSLGSEAAAPAASDTPDWLNSLGSEAAAPAASDTPDWLSSLGSEAAAPAASDTPDWLNSLGSEAAAPAASDTPDWLSGLGAAAVSISPESPAQPEINLGAPPSWLQSAAPQPTQYNELPAESTDDTPDWLSSLPASTPVTQPEPPSTPGSELGSTDSLFTDMPDWLSNSAETPASTETVESPVESEDIAASQLPAWVQAMRPVEAVVADISTPSKETIESRGALAGLQGVLPAVSGYKPTSKPKTYSLKLQASDDQLAQAALLEQILAAETSPVPIASFSPLRASRALRWMLALIFFAATFAALVMGIQIFSLPVGIPVEINGAIQTIRAIPDSSPVLVAFDYEAARTGEMEAAAAPLFDQLALRAIRFTTISTTETGAVLAERFMKEGPLASHSQNGLAYTNLGYLAGGQMGIRAFVQNPKDTAVFDVNLARAWDAPALQGVDTFSNFATFIIITDNAESARAWVEQIAALQTSTPVVVISSAQSAPMIQPYYASGQIKGLVSGLYGGSVFEQSNAGRPGTTRIYWDAYSIGMLAATVLIIIGGLWSLIAGIRERAAAREAN